MISEKNVSNKSYTEGGK